MFDALIGFFGQVLAFFYQIVPNVGISIILFTLAVNLVLFPLTLKQTRSTRAMQVLQPEMKELQKKYKEEPEKLQKEMVALYRKHGASPGGCIVPLIVQLPIFFALFRLLRSPLVHLPDPSALRDVFADGEARFLGMDLTSTAVKAWGVGPVEALPYVIGILLMVGAQLAQSLHAQRGQQMDSRQAQQMQLMTKFMPLFFGVISFSFESGLVIYWGTSNLFRFLQQILIFRMDGRPPTSAEKADKRPDDETAQQPHTRSRRRRRRR